jgi:hypothetical protein
MAVKSRGIHLSQYPRLLHDLQICNKASEGVHPAAEENSSAGV